MLLCVAAYFALREKLSSDTITKGEEETVAIADTAAVKKVTIGKNGVTRVISRGNEGWLVNGRYKTAYRPTALLLVGLNQLRIKRPVSEESKQKVYKEVMQQGTVVTIETGEGNKVLRFLSNPADVNTTYLVTENSATPYVAYVPGIPGDINNLFNLTENDWRTRKLFASNPRSIDTLKVSYPKDPQGSFEIVYHNGDFSIPGIPAPDSVALRNYLTLYQNAPLTAYLTDKKDSAEAVLRRSELAGTIELSDLKAQNSAQVKVYKDPQNKKEYLGVIPSTGEPVLLDKELFDALMVKKSFFRKR